MSVLVLLQRELSDSGLSGHGPGARSVHFRQYRKQHSSVMSKRSQRAAAHCALLPRSLRNGAGGGPDLALHTGGLPEQPLHALDICGKLQTTLLDGTLSGARGSPRVDWRYCVLVEGREERRPEGPGRGCRKGGGGCGARLSETSSARTVRIPVLGCRMSGSSRQLIWVCGPRSGRAAAFRNGPAKFRRTDHSDGIAA